MRKLSLYLVVLIVLLNLTACVVTVNNNFGSGITTNKTVDDIGIGQEYDAEVKR